MFESLEDGSSEYATTPSAMSSSTRSSSGGGGASSSFTPKSSYSRDPLDRSLLLSSEGALPPPLQLSEEAIDGLLAQREEARSNGDFETSDHLRDELRGKGINTDDRSKLWRADYAMPKKEGHKYERRTGDEAQGGNADVDGEQVVEIERLLAERSAAKVSE
jgi:hypothetical protein